MAEGPAGDDDRMSDDIQKCPDTSNLFCDTCLQEENHVEAHGYCIDCNEYLCLDCFRYHRRAKPSRNHVLQDKYDMPTKKPDQKTIYDACLIHENEALSLFCKIHDTTICKLCKVAAHRKCEEVSKIADICHNVFASAEFKGVKERLQNLKQVFENGTQKTKNNVVEIEKYYNGAIEEVTKVISEIRNRDMELMKSIDVACEASAKAISSIISNLNILEDTGQSEQAFLTQKKAESKLKAFEEASKSVEEDNNRFTAYAFIADADPDVTKILGKIQKIIPRTDINIVTSSDTAKCNITGMDALCDNMLIVADRGNKKLKLINISTRSVTSELKLDCPWDLVKVCDDRVVVTMYDKQQAVLVKCTDTLELLKTFKTGGYEYYQGVAFDGYSLIISYYSPERIEFVNMDGSVRKTIDAQERKDVKRFEDVEHIALSSDKAMLYLSDDPGIIRMRIDGTVLSSFTHEQLMSPKGITFGPNGNVYVCSQDSHKIFEISPDLFSGQVFLDEQNGISKPHSIYYSKTQSKLFIGSAGKNELQVFLV